MSFGVEPVNWPRRIDHAVRFGAAEHPISGVSGMVREVTTEPMLESTTIAVTTSRTTRGEYTVS